MTAGIWTLTALAASFTLFAARVGAAETELISVGASTGEAIGYSALRGSDAMSADGRYVVFQSAKYGLVFGDTNRLGDIFVRDRWLGATRRVSVASDGTQSNGYSDAPAISADGRYVVFQSTASNLVPGLGANNGWTNIYLHDMATKRTELVSVASSGGYPDQGSYVPTVSGDGRYVAFMSTSTNLIAGYSGVERSVYVRDRQAGRTELINAGWAYSVSISRDGRYVAFDSDARDTMNENVYVRDRTTGVRELISATPSGNPGAHGASAPMISADGRYVAFQSYSYNLVPDDSNGFSDVFVRDRQLKSTSLVSLDSTGRQLARGGESCGTFFGPAISADGRYITFVSGDPFVVPDDINGTRDAFVRDTWLQRTLLVTAGRQGSSVDDSPTCAISGDGRYVAFDSYASGFAPNDLNVQQDVFVRDFGSDGGSTDPTFTLRPQALDFGDQPVGSTTVRNAYIRNTGDVPLSVTAVRVRGDDAMMFSAADQCGTAVPAGSGCAIRVTYAPTAAGAHSATLVLVVGGDIRRHRPLSGVGVAP